LGRCRGFITVIDSTAAADGGLGAIVHDVMGGHGDRLGDPTSRTG